MDRSPLIAAAIIMAAMVGGWLAMPSVMEAVSGGGPWAGLAVALVFMVGFFGVLWLRARHQNRKVD